MGFSSGGGGSGNIAGSTDVALNNPSNNEVLTYDTSVSKWKNSQAGSAELRWDADARTWPARPQSAPFVLRTYRQTTLLQRYPRMQT